MGSRIKKNPIRLFDCFLEIVRPSDDDAATTEQQMEGHRILQSFPVNYKDKEAKKLKSVPSFAFPCHIDIVAVQNFSFVLTEEDSQLTFGYCRLAPRADTAFVILSGVPWHDFFFRILNNAGELCMKSTNKAVGSGGLDGGEAEMWSFVEACYSVHGARLPVPGSYFHVSWEQPANGDFTCPVPVSHGLPTIPENGNLVEYFNAVGLDTMLEIFAAMLHERRVVMTSSKLNRLSACVQAANTLIYPMFWQHIFIPILPKQLMGYLQAPMPFLIGVPSTVMKHVRLDELGDAVLVDADANKVLSPHADLDRIPEEVIANFRRAQKSAGGDLAGDTVARMFLRAIVHLIGGYRSALKMRPGEKITFDDDAFVNTRSASVRPFLESLLELQIFRQFVEDRLQMLNEGRATSDEFEKEIMFFAEKASKHNSNSQKIRSQAAAIGSSVRKEGGAIVKAVKTNPAVKQAVKSVKAGSKIAYKGVKSKMRENHSASNLANLRAIGGGGSGRGGSPGGSVRNHRTQMTGGIDVGDKPRSAPTSPVLNGGGGRKTLMESDRGGGGYSTGGSSHTNSSAGGDSGGINSNQHSGGKSSSSSSMFRANTDLGFVPQVLKYERFDPPLLTVDANTVAEDEAAAVQHESSPEFEAMPPLNLDLMSELEHFINRPPTVGTTTAMAHQATTAPLPAAPGTTNSINKNPLAENAKKNSSPNVQDLMSFQLDENQEHEVIFDPLQQQQQQQQNQQARGPPPARPPPPPPVAAPRRASIKNQQQLPMPPPPPPLQQQQPSSSHHHRPLSRSNAANPPETMTSSKPPLTSSKPPLLTSARSSEILLLEYGLDFGKMSLPPGVTSSTSVTSSANSSISSSQHRPLMTAVPAAAAVSTTAGPVQSDPFADLDPLKQGGGAHAPQPAPRTSTRAVSSVVPPSTSKAVSSVAAPLASSSLAVNPFSPPVAPPRAKKNSCDPSWQPLAPSPQPTDPRRLAWTKFE